MGWCSATDIMDAALNAAEAAVKVIVDEFAPPGDGLAGDTQERVDMALRPFVVTIAEKLRDSDWDCIEESHYFDRFSQEMLGMEDDGYVSYLHEQLKDTEPYEFNYADLVRKLAAVVAKRESRN